MRLAKTGVADIHEFDYRRINLTIVRNETKHD